MKEKLKIIISGGGTAGHIYPALAVAERLRERGHEILFVGAHGRMEMQRVPMAGFEIEGLPVVGIQRRLTLSNLAVPFKFFRSQRMARAIIRRFSPDVVVGFGGYASAPILRSASRQGIPTLLQEQNSYAGLTNKLLAKRSKVICVAYTGMEQFFPQEKIRLTGNPLRVAPSSEITRTEGCRAMGVDPSKRTILLTGGSLGTRTLNEAVIALLGSAKMPKDVELIWQCGKYYLQEMISRSEGHTTKPVAFIESMSAAYAAADLVIARSGASTVSELQLLGKATIFVPSPNVAEDHQTKNARSMVEAGAAVMVRDAEAVEKLFDKAFELLDNPTLLEEMGKKINTFAMPNATQEVAELVESIAKTK
ncbi:MAG: undecaprenyldiphospho-muramoylpentapeptide beta-N-acetylglucosaminyltransferase [Rikenellaceae bacterium]